MSELEDDILMAYLAQGREMVLLKEQVVVMERLFAGYREMHLRFDHWLKAIPEPLRAGVPALENALLVGAIARVLELEDDVHELSTSKEEG